MPGPEVHLRLTALWAAEEGLSPADAEHVGLEDLHVDALWPGSRKPWRHFNPTAALVFAPMYLRRAVALAGEPEARDEALTWLGRSLHSKQDSIGHGTLGLTHIRWDLGLLKRHPDVWETMPPRMQARIEAATRAALRRFVAALGAPTTPSALA